MMPSLCLMIAASFLQDGYITDESKSPPSPVDAPSVMIEVRLLQVDVPESSGVPLIADIPLLGRLLGDKTEAQEAPNAGRGESFGTSGGAAFPAVNVRLQPMDGPLAVVLAARDWDLRIGELVLNVRNGEISTADDGEPQPWRMLSTPRLVVSVGQEASIAVGREVPYMVRQDDGSFVLERSEEKFEGIRFSVLIDTADEDVVSVKELHLKVNNMIGRVELEDVQLDIGPPIMRTIEASLSLKLRPDHTAVVALPSETDGPASIFLLLKTRVVTESEPGSDK